MHTLLLSLFAVLLQSGMTRRVTLQRGASDTYTLQLERGQSAAIVVHQQGVDVVVDVMSPDGTRLDSFDSPTGRNGDENVEVIAAKSGVYELLIHPFDAREPVGDYTLEVAAIRSVAETDAMLAGRAKARNDATAWLKMRSEPIASGLRHFGELAQQARVVGIGEATHGSREFGDARLMLTKLLIQRYGFRVVAVEASASRLESSWIGRRALHELIGFVDAWNASHAADRVEIVGVDAQQNAAPRAVLGAFVEKAYGPSVLIAWNAAEKEIAAADEQTAVFGDSSVSSAARDSVLKLRAMLDLDAPLLRARFGDHALAEAQRAADVVAQFADFNSNDPTAHSRDWYMAVDVLAAAGTSRRVVFWAHNAHVAAPHTGRSTGATLRSVLGCAYAPIAVTFGEGAFVAQVPNTADDRLAVSTVGPAPPETIESVAAQAGSGALLITWGCSVAHADLPPWLQTQHLMHWIGGLYAPESLPSAAFRSFNLVDDFDALLYLPQVTAEEIPTDRPRIPPRQH